MNYPSLKELKEKALAATRGPWSFDDQMVWDNSGDAIVSFHDEEKRSYFEFETGPFIAAANPQTVLALIEDYEITVAALIKIMTPEKDIGLGCYHAVYALEALEKLKLK